MEEQGLQIEVTNSFLTSSGSLNTLIYNKHFFLSLSGDITHIYQENSVTLGQKMVLIVHKPFYLFSRLDQDKQHCQSQYIFS